MKCESNITHTTFYLKNVTEYMSKKINSYSLTTFVTTCCTIPFPNLYKGQMLGPGENPTLLSGALFKYPAPEPVRPNILIMVHFLDYRCHKLFTNTWGCMEELVVTSTVIKKQIPVCRFKTSP